ncbi:YolD-like family protein [Bacillus sp. ISL-40]|uniref:YolD-like family protein n=1 Tax=unclassified Bacillus (in: firmicutes) TaxID=185979 RepID=UPI001BE80506|nr:MULTISPECIES: YolD-like family protein [unclassified Bacillus (in: firmicutes)]MBT2701582.1 YolD-like family protein [Bacillus sp. ISL-40]MBT2722654.1 YolD-like family protein [Bacillus sp. ISL-46]MBT2743341.1 YolD-like family protein [Bacillus sp. ISL-77]
MTIRDRGLIKWNAASFMPQVFEQQRDMFKDQERQPRPLLSEFDTEEFDQRIAYAMEYNFAVKLSVWTDGFTTDMTGRIHHIDPITHQLRIEVKPGEFERVTFDDVCGVTVVD